MYRIQDLMDHVMRDANFAGYGQLARGEIADAPHVQIYRRGVVLCGLVRDAFTTKDSHKDIFLVETMVGKVWSEGSRVMACSGVDGRCTCAEEEGAERAAGGAPACGEGASGARSAAPLSNTGVTVEQGARL